MMVGGAVASAIASEAVSPAAGAFSNVVLLAGAVGVAIVLSLLLAGRYPGSGFSHLQGRAVLYTQARPPGTRVRRTRLARFPAADQAATKQRRFRALFRTCDRIFPLHSAPT
jgi:hypothetical protein